ncbi:glycoside hydrolase family 5 protein [Xylona heveae TC161]|uniref:Glycoside hydrolase family 5 protein n=1 Tax=Xylona heveae (strain CBS 132557 / TC161) TaxID=1328760 RepID=A0A165G7F7_XYLHT|nr:glycoside hydrolase family 5 protein [Xylona heveae TC161]KZF21825.1 glycoside hydrolase family 5 protein [Xylona heveae TC161]
MSPLRLRVDGATFRDPQNREVTLRGINVAGDAKFPAQPDIPSYISDKFFDGDNVSFVDRPFPVQDAHVHFSRLKRWGYNTIRYVFTWEAIEHAGPGKYDEEWIEHTISLLRLAKSYDFYVFMDPHQDVWSRFTGGSGAPMWTIYAMGLNPEGFAATEAALVHNTYPNPEEYPKMIWATNYTRMACQLIFTLFFAGKVFAPKAIIDGVNIQDYLQNHFLGACEYLARRIHEAGDLENEVVIGWESLNEPNRGLVGYEDISVIPGSQRLQKGTSPTAWQAILLGSGRPCEIDTWDFGNLGPYRSGRALVDPKGEAAWLPADYDDSKYGWHRSPEWKLGECLWAQHGVWDPSNDVLLRKDYFLYHPKTGEKLDYEVFTNTYWLDYYRKHSKMVKRWQPDAIMFCQPPVLEIPPSIKGTEDDDPNIVYAPHFYDGITLIMKKWNRFWNVDVFGVLRGRYLTPAFAIKIGETNIRNCLRDQLAAMRKEGLDYMGNHPCIFTEIGIPYDMDDRYAYKTGDYSSQIAAMDANHFALEGSKVNGFALWVYVPGNNHKWGDNWNGEDLSIFSVDDRLLPSNSPVAGDNTSKSSVDLASPTFSRSQSTDASTVLPANVKATLSKPSLKSEPSAVTNGEQPRAPGYRAAEAVVRPSPVFTVGDVRGYSFDLRNCIFQVAVSSTAPTKQDAPTVMFLPEFHFPRNDTQVEVSGGKWSITLEETHGTELQYLSWWHGEGEQTITVKGAKMRQGLFLGRDDEDDGYLNQCQQSSCSIM